jgi:hypothetical protein
LLAKLQQEDDSDVDDAHSDEDDQAAAAHGKRVTIAVPEGADESGELQPAPKRKGRKATGAPTKEQLLAKLQQEEDDDEDEDSEDEHLDTACQRKVRFDAREETHELPTIMAAPKRRGRKATGVVTKEQLLDALSASEASAADSEGDAEEAAPAPRTRCAGRKGTAFVPAARAELFEDLAEVLEEGAEKAVGPSAGWTWCCN